MYQHSPWWTKALGTGVTLIIILSIVIVAFHGALAHELQHFESPSTNRCEINLQEAHDIGNIQLTDGEKRACANGLDLKIRDLSQLPLLDESLPIRKLNIEPETETENDIDIDIDIDTFYQKPFDQLTELHMSNVMVYGTTEANKSNAKLKLLSIHRDRGNRDLNELIHQFPVQSLETLDLSANSLPNQLNRFYFVNMTALREILLIDCQIEQFPFDTFHFVRNTIQLINLTGNRLIKLAPGFLSTIPEPTLNQLTIRLDNNPWMCRCFTASLSQRLLCLENCRPSIGGRSSNGVNKRVEADGVVELQCEDLSDSTKTEVVLLKKQTHNITIEPKDELLLRIMVTGPPNAYLIWYNDSFAFNMDNDQRIADYMHCNDRPKFELAVIENSTYTFCVLTSSESDAISPFNCVAYYVNPKSSNSTDPDLVWFTNGQKGMVYAIVISSILVLMIFGILLGIFLIRKYPHLLKDHQSPYLLDNSNRFSKRSSCTSSSVFSVEDNNTIDYIPTYVTPKNFDFVKPPKEKEVIALDASRLECGEKQMTENHHESIKLYWDNTQKLPTPPPTPNPNGNKNEEENNFSDNNNKELDKQIDLPIDNPNEEGAKKIDYAEFDKNQKQNE
ncbi:uncharacterized protein LOC129575831 [Sitodiplosis mosellana]|uniref:uncharacterized protein LOC129575831 n=1 Tax=Sitodiplosis mosellana TaxID=263140 RepID=UPI002444D0A0|nr:uncharacterized protein LOC129575831 [Sitodiplosis mosellana]XP_055315912.1 uncharacterized protein LOC129575831 [Sitodiplosis mosellana]XP_055315913.1 uncharacterized protein LOC129575831 [Sitodiplosis mosellana]